MARLISEKTNFNILLVSISLATSLGDATVTRSREGTEDTKEPHEAWDSLREREG